MQNIRLLTVFIAGVWIAVSVTNLEAEDAAEVTEPGAGEAQKTEVAPTPKKKLNLPRSGELATLVITNESSVEGPMPWGSGKQIDTLKSPLMGSITQVGENWMVRISNTSKDRTLNANFELAQYNDNGQKVRSEPFTYSLRPKESVERSVRSAQNVTRILLNLTDWKEK